jgi:hypothetical protein
MKVKRVGWSGPSEGLQDRDAFAALDSEDECERQARIALVRELDPAAQDGRAPSDSGSAVATGLRARACAKASASQNGY